MNELDRAILAIGIGLFVIVGGTLIYNIIVSRKGRK